jgi:hypothetical protein
MKNIHLLPTDKPSRLLYFRTSKELTLYVYPTTFRAFERSTQNIYITSDEEIKEGDWYIHKQINYLRVSNSTAIPMDAKKIILTTDQDLIKDGVQAIDDEFLKWWIKNPSCDRIDFVLINDIEPWYKIRFPKEEPKQNEMVGNKFYKSADKVISINKKYNMKYKTVLNISIEDKGNYKNIFKVKSKYYKLNNDEKETLLKELMFWARQEINNLHPEQE